MPYEFKWLEEPHYYLATLTGNMSQDEIDEWMTRVLEVLEHEQNPLSIIIDMRTGPKFLFNAIKLQTVQRVAHHPRLEWVVVVGASALIGLWLVTLRRMAGLKFRVVSTIEQAAEFVHNVEHVEQQNIEPKID